MTRDVKPLPCPFCGRSPRITTRASGTAMDPPGAKWISFAACYGGGYSAHAHHYGQGATQEASAIAAVEKWNARAPILLTRPESEADAPERADAEPDLMTAGESEKTSLQAGDLDGAIRGPIEPDATR